MLAYTTRGEGPRTIMMLHGFLGSGRNLGALARRLTEREPSLRVVLPDLTGHGSSPPLPEGADLATLAGDVLELARGLEISEPFDVVGHSLGGRVALRLRRLAPEAVGRVVLLDSSPARLEERTSELTDVLGALLAAPAEAADRQEMVEALRAHGLSKSLIDWLVMNAVPHGDRLRWRFDREALRDLLARTRGEDLFPALDVRAGDVTLVRGGRSEFVHLDDARTVEARGGHVVTIEEAGHYLHVESPEAVLDAVQSALARPRAAD